MPNRIRPEENEYIKMHCLSDSDEAIATYLKRDVRSIRSARKKLGITKKSGGILNAIDLSKKDEKSGQRESVILNASKKLNEEQRKEFYKTQFCNSLYYKNLKEQFTEDELDFYLEEWGTLCVQFEDIVATERRQIDELIKISIMGNRILRNIRITEDEISLLQDELMKFRLSHPEIADDETLQERDNLLMSLIRSMSGQSEGMSNSYAKNITMKNQILGELNARRKDRVDQLFKRGTTFLGLVQALRDNETRENYGRHMELVRLAKEKKKSEWRRQNTFPDGSKDCVLLDELSELPKEAEVVLIKDMTLVEIYSKHKGKKILVVEDDLERSKFFAQVFFGNTVDFASCCDKAEDYLHENHYDLICLDYDVGLDQKTKTITSVVNANLAQDILIHSENKEGVKELQTWIKGKNIEIQPFYEILKKAKGT